MSKHFKAGKNQTALSDALWFIYRIYLGGYGKDFKEAIRLYDRDLRDPFCYTPPYKEELLGMNLIREYLNE